MFAIYIKLHLMLQCLNYDHIYILIFNLPNLNIFYNAVAIVLHYLPQINTMFLCNFLTLKFHNNRKNSKCSIQGQLPLGEIDKFSQCQAISGS